MGCCGKTGATFAPDAVRDACRASFGKSWRPASLIFLEQMNWRAAAIRNTPGRRPALQWHTSFRQQFLDFGFEAVASVHLPQVALLVHEPQGRNAIDAIPLAEFVLPALTALEKRFVLPAILVSFGLFLTGVVTCYFWLLPKTILFFFHDTESLGWTAAWTVQEYYSFVTRFTIGFGLAFELPVVVLTLVRFGLVTYSFMARTRPYAIVLIFILATIITPTPDILTLIAMSLPMCLLYESCIWIAWFMQRKALKNASHG